MSKFFMHWFKIKARDFADAGITKLQHRSEIRKFRIPGGKKFTRKCSLQIRKRIRLRNCLRKIMGGYTRYLAQTLYGIYRAV